MHLPLQCRLERQLPNIHARHPAAAIDPRSMFSNAVSLLLGDNACAGTTSLPSPSPTETAFAVAVSHCDGVEQAFTLEQMPRGEGLRAGGVQIML